MKTDISPVGEHRILTPVATMVQGAKRFDVSEWSLAREISSGYPQRLVAGSGITAATGEATIEDTTPFQRNIQTILSDSSSIKAGAPIFFNVGYQETGQTRALSGYIDSVSQNFIENQTSVSMVDTIERLNRSVSYDGLLDVMPPVNGSTVHRPVGVRAEYFVDRALRRGGWHTTPHPVGKVLLHAPMVGSLWPHTGTVLQSGSYENVGASAPTFSVSNFGWGLRDGRAYYQLSDSSLSPSTGLFELTGCIDTSRHSGATNIRLVCGESGWVDLRLTSNGVSLTDTSGAVIAYLGSSAAANAYTVRFSQGAVLLADDNGRTQNGVAPAGLGAITEIRVAAENSCFGGLSLAVPTSDKLLAQSWRRSAHLKCGSLHSSLLALPDVYGKTAGALLHEISGALMSAMWIDEVGDFHWVDADVLRNGTPVREVTTNDSLLSLHIKDDILSRIGSITVRGKEPQISRSTRAIRDVWVGTGETLDPRDTVKYLLSPDDNGLWVGVAPPALLRYEQTYLQQPFSWYGASRSVGEDEVLVTDSLKATWGKIRPGLWKLEIVNTGNDEIQLHIPASAQFRKSLQGNGLPVIRAQGEVKWLPAESNATAPGGGVSDFEHDCDVWVQRASHRQRIADYLAKSLSAGFPVVDDIGIIPDYSFQLGDHIRLKDTIFSNFQAHGVVIGISMSGNGTDVSMKLKIVVIAATDKQQLIGDGGGLVSDVDNKNQSLTVGAVDLRGGV